MLKQKRSSYRRHIILKCDKAVLIFLKYAEHVLPSLLKSGKNLQDWQFVQFRFYQIDVNDLILAHAHHKILLLF